ncbi:MAG: hypothetical protein QOJ19_1261, partial [Acidimicrobiia bacterium]|nr:hypothetical protein [Acidimicrobiia bacterium]
MKCAVSTSGSPHNMNIQRIQLNCVPSPSGANSGVRLSRKLWTPSVKSGPTNDSFMISFESA